MSKPSYINEINSLAKQQVPFIFIIDYTGEKAIVKKLYWHSKFK